MTAIRPIEAVPAETVPTFAEFPSIARLSREIVITEKIDGTNAQVHITEDGRLYAGSRTRWITPEADNFGFARWVQEHLAELMELGPGSHFGEWWGAGIQRKYGLNHKRFSLFNVGRWIECESRRTDEKQSVVPPCCCVVPVLWRGVFSTQQIDAILNGLEHDGSSAAPGFMQPEGIVIYHEKSRTLFKKTIGDDGHKGARP